MSRGTGRDVPGPIVSDGQSPTAPGSSAAGVNRRVMNEQMASDAHSRPQRPRPHIFSGSHRRRFG
jgi:hypothetical protein